MHGRLARIARDEGLPFGLGDSRCDPTPSTPIGCSPQPCATVWSGNELSPTSCSRPTGAAARTWALPASLRPQQRRPACRAAAAEAVMDGDDYAAEVRAEERLATDLGIHAVPTFVIAGRLMVSGAQSPQVLADAVRQASGTD